MRNVPSDALPLGCASWARNRYRAGEAVRSGSVKPFLGLCLRHDMDVPVLLPAGFVVFVAHRPFLAVTGGGQLIARNSQLHQVVLSRLRPLLRSEEHTSELQ